MFKALWNTITAIFWIIICVAAFVALASGAGGPVFMGVAFVVVAVAFNNWMQNGKD